MTSHQRLLICYPQRQELKKPGPGDLQLGQAQDSIYIYMSPTPKPYNHEIAMEICDRLTSESLVKILRDEHMPSYSTIMRWLRVESHFRHNYAQARQDQGDYAADLVADVANAVLAGDITPEQGRVAIDAHKWAAGKRNAKAYGDTSRLEINGTVSHALSVLTDAEIVQRLDNLRHSQALISNDFKVLDYEG